MAGLLSACTPSVLVPDGDKHVCRVTVVEKFGPIVLLPNPLSGPSGGAAMGVDESGASIAFRSGISAAGLFAPFIAIGGAVNGAACAAASLSHPSAEADFDKVLRSADAGSMKRALVASLDTAWAGPGCARAVASGAATDITVEIEKIVVMMGCAYGAQGYWIDVAWRSMATTGRQLQSAPTTFCEFRSDRDVDAWFADPDQARSEIEQVMARVGHQMAATLVHGDSSSSCSLRVGQAGEIERLRRGR